MRFEFPTEEAAPEKGPRLFRRKDNASREAPARTDPEGLLKQLEVLVKQFEEQQQGLVENLTSLRRTIAGFDQ